jgi:hypothetical protein
MADTTRDKIGKVALRCSECGRKFDPDGEFNTGGLTDDESPTGKAMCYRCFDKRPCKGCRGL